MFPSLRRLLPVIALTFSLPAASVLTADDVAAQLAHAHPGVDTLAVQPAAPQYHTVPAILGGTLGSLAGATVGFAAWVGSAANGSEDLFTPVALVGAASAVGAALLASGGVAAAGGHPDIGRALLGGAIGFGAGVIAWQAFEGRGTPLVTFALAQGIVTGIFASH